MENERVIDRKKMLGYSAILSILVVLIHTENLGTFSVSPDGSLLDRFVYFFERFISGNIAKIGVPSFFMLSGVLFYRDFTFKKYPEKMKKRFFSLLIPFYLWNFFRFAFFYALGKWDTVSRFLAINPIYFTTENLINSIFFYKYNLGYWFMYQLILYTVLSPLIYILLKNKKVAVLSLTALFIVFSTDVLGELSVNVFHGRFIQVDGLFYYMFGAFFGMHYFDIVNKRGKNVTKVALVGILLGQALLVAFNKTNVLAFYLLFCSVMSVSFWYAYDGLVKREITTKISTITFFIYSAHGTVLELLQAGFGALVPKNSAFALVEYLILPIITLTILVLVSLFLKKYLSRIWRVLNGSR